MKRVIGLPGETVEIVNGMVYIDGRKLEEVISVEPMRVAGLADKAILLGENEYFVLGDNRNNSEDSRFSNVGVVDMEDIVGRAILRIFPFDSFGGLDKE